MKSLAMMTAAILSAGSLLYGSVHTEAFTYTDGERNFEGYLAHPEGLAEPAPGIVVVHQYMGPTDHERDAARKLAEMGYVAMVTDIYGVTLRPANRQEAGATAGSFRNNDRRLLRERVGLGHDWLKEHSLVDETRTAAIGYCFGGTAALELARDGADVTGVVSFHGGLGTPATDDPPITAKILVLHGAADPLVPIDEVAAFQDEMHELEVDWQLIAYGGALHAFTEPGSDDVDSPAVGYDPKADRRSWKAMEVFFDEILAD